MRIIFISFFFLVLNQSTFSQQQQTIKALDAYLTAFYEYRNIPSISAGVAQDGKIIWLGARGYADIENNVPATPKTVYRIASISKSITAVAVMQLVEQGKINLDADARNYIPGFAKKKWKFTTRQLLTHTSGIRDYKPGEFDSKDYYKTTDDIIEYLAKDPLVYEPGTRYVYSTLAYNLLAAIVEKVSGMTFPQYLKRNIFEPAGMNSSDVEFQKRLVQNRAHGYIKGPERTILNAPLADLSIKFAGGGVISNSEDLLKFAISLMEGKLLKPATLDSMLTPLRLRNGDSRKYGLGFETGTDGNGRKYYGHTGGGTGFASLLRIYPNDKVASVHLTNVRDRNIYDPATDLAAIVLKTDYNMPRKSLADRLAYIFLENNLDSAIVEYKKIAADTSKAYWQGEDELNMFGYDLMDMGKYYDAIKFYRFFLSEFPASFAAYVGLADAYRLDGNTGLAINNYRKALRINPLDAYSESMIRRLNQNKTKIKPF